MLTFTQNMYPDVFFLKKVEHKLTSKKITDIPADTLEMKKWENGSLIITNWLSRRRKIMVHTLFWCQIMYRT